MQLLQRVFVSVQGQTQTLKDRVDRSISPTNNSADLRRAYASFALLVSVSEESMLPGPPHSASSMRPSRTSTVEVGGDRQQTPCETTRYQSTSQTRTCSSVYKKMTKSLTASSQTGVSRQVE